MKHADQVSEIFNGSWTIEQDKKLMELVATGMTYRKIGYAIGRTRASCIGRAHRLKIVRPRVKKEAKGPKQKTVVKESIRHKPTAPWKYTGEITILELRENTCRWPSDDKPVKYCGKPVYKKWCCEEHFKIAYRQNNCVPTKTE